MTTVTDNIENTTDKMTKKKSPWRWLKRFIYTLLGFLVLLIGLLVFIVFTESGLRLVNYGLQKSPLNEMIQIDQLSGTLWKGIQFKQFHLTLNDEDYVSVSDAHLSWDLRDIYQMKLKVNQVAVSKVDVVLLKESEPTPPDPDATPFLPFSFDRGRLPIDIFIGEVDVKNIKVALPTLTVLGRDAHVYDGTITNETWAFKDVAYQGALNFGEDISIPLNATASIDADRIADDVNIRLKNVTSNMRVGEDYFDHASSLIISGSLNNLEVLDSMTFNWPTKIAKPVVIEAKVNIKNQADLAWHLTLFNVSNQLSSQGEWSMANPTALTAQLDLNMKELKDSYPELSGVVEGNFHFAGDVKKPLLSGNIKGSDITGFGLNLTSISLFAQHNDVQTTEFLMQLNDLQFNEFKMAQAKVVLDAEKLETFDFSLTAQNVMDKEKVIVDEVALTSVGSLESHDIHLKIRSIFNTTDFMAIGHIHDADEDPTWSMNIQKFDVYNDIVGAYHLSKPAELIVSPEKTSLSQMCLQNLPTTMCMQGQHTAADSFGTVAIRRLKPKQLNALLPPEINIDTALDLVIAGQFKDQQNFVGIVDASLAAGTIRYRMQGYELTVPLTKTQMLVRANPKEINSSINVDWGDYLQVHGGGVMTDPFGEQLVDANVKGNAPRLNWLLPIIPALQKLEGQLTMNANASGKLSEGLHAGFGIHLANGAIYNAEYNSDIKNIALNVTLDKGKPILIVAGGLTAGTGRMTINGDVNLLTTDMNVKVRGNNLLLANSNNVKALLSPSVDVVLNNKKMNMTGQLDVPELKFIYKSSDDPRGSVQKVSPDTIVISSQKAPVEPKRPSNFWNNTTMNFKVNLGNNVSVGAVGFVGKLTGGIELTKAIDDPLRAIGIINVGSGVYNILGQELTLDKGKIQFAGLDLANPNIEFQASRTFDNKRTGSKVNVGVRVTGTAQNPKLNLFSQPPMPTNSIVAYLALGTDVDSLTAVEVLQIAKMAQRIATGEIVTSPEDGFAKSMGLTDFGVMKDLSGNTSLGIGKYLTKNFYVGVGFSIFEENNGAFGIMKYNFFKNFSFDTQVSDEYTTMDFRFSKEI